MGYELSTPSDDLEEVGKGLSVQTRKCSSMDSVEPQTGLRPAGQVSPGFYSDPLFCPSSSQQERDPLRPGFFQSVPAQHLPHRGRENCCTDSRTMVQMVKNLPANAGDSRDAGLISVLGRPLEKEMATHSSILAWKMTWTEELGGLHSPWGGKELDMTEHVRAHTRAHTHTHTHIGP